MAEPTVLEDRDLRLWRRGPGELPRWVTVLGGAAAVLSALAAYLGPANLWESVKDRPWTEAAVLVFAAVIAVALVPRGRVTRAMRLVLAAPAAQLAALAVVAVQWGRAAPTNHDAPLVGPLPLPIAIAAIAAVLIAAGAAAAPRRERLHGVVMMTLASLLLAGTWLPIAAALEANHLEHAVRLVGFRAINDASLAAFAFIPPFGAAAIYTTLAMRRPHVLRGRVVIAGGLLVAGALLARLDPSSLAATLFGRLIYVELALLAASVVGLVVLAVTLVRGAARARQIVDRDPRTLRGTIGGDEPAAWLVVTSWLRCPRLVALPFELDAHGVRIPVPGDVAIAGIVPPVSTLLRTGEALALAAPGDRASVAGFIDADATEAYRGTRGTLVGPRGLTVVLERGPTDSRAADLAYALWRPCAAYLAIVLAVAAPALVSTLAVERAPHMRVIEETAPNATFHRMEQHDYEPRVRRSPAGS